jgi:MFS family permease
LQLKKALASRYFLILCVMGAFAILSSTMSKNPVLNPFAHYLKPPEKLTGFIAAASTIPGLIISLPAGSLSENLGRRKMLLLSAFIFASAPFLYLIVTNWWELALVRFYHGFATAIFVPVAEASIAERYPTKLGERISTFNSATYVGRGVAPFLGGAILSVTNGGSSNLTNFGVLYLSVAVAGVTALISAMFLPKDTEDASALPAKTKLSNAQMLRGWIDVARNKGALTVSFVQAIQYYSYGVVEFYLVQYMQLVAGLNALQWGIVMGAQLISLIVFRPIMGRLSDRVSRRIPVVLGCLISAVLLFLIPFTISFSALIAISIGFGVGFAMTIASTSPMMVESTVGIPVGTSMGFLSTMMDVGQAVGPIISGFILASVLSYSGLFSSLTVLLAVSAVVFLASGLGKEKEAKKPKNRTS